MAPPVPCFVGVGGATLIFYAVWWVSTHSVILSVWAGSVSGVGSAAIRGVMLCAGVYTVGVLIRPTLRGLIARPSPWLALQGISAPPHLLIAR